MPEFHERDHGASGVEARVLAGEVELDEIDTEPYAVARRRR